MTLLKELCKLLEPELDMKIKKSSKRDRARHYISFRKVHPNNPPRFTDTPPQVGAATDKFNARGIG